MPQSAAAPPPPLVVVATSAVAVALFMFGSQPSFPQPLPAGAATAHRVNIELTDDDTTPSNGTCSVCASEKDIQTQIS